VLVVGLLDAVPDRMLLNHVIQQALGVFEPLATH